MTRTNDTKIVAICISSSGNVSQVPDERLETLASLAKSEKTIYEDSNQSSFDMFSPFPERNTKQKERYCIAHAFMNVLHL